MDSIHERLKAVRLHYELSQEEFGNNISIKSRAHISALESGARNVTDRIVKDVCAKYCVNEEWLRSGTSSMLVKQSSDLLEQLRQEYNLDELQFIFISEYLNLSTDEREAIFSFFARIFGRNSATLAKESSDDNMIQKELKSYQRELVDEKRETTLPASQNINESIS